MVETSVVEASGGIKPVWVAYVQACSAHTWGWGCTQGSHFMAFKRCALDEQARASEYPDGTVAELD